jgi:hypothetical protein
LRIFFEANRIQSNGVFAQALGPTIQLWAMNFQLGLARFATQKLYLRPNVVLTQRNVWL